MNWKKSRIAVLMVVCISGNARDIEWYIPSSGRCHRNKHRSFLLYIFLFHSLCLCCFLIFSSLSRSHSCSLTLLLLFNVVILAHRHKKNDEGMICTFCVRSIDGWKMRKIQTVGENGLAIQTIEQRKRLYVDFSGDHCLASRS